MENDTLRKQTIGTINLKNGNLVSSDDKKKLKIGRHVTKYKRYKNLSDLKKAANYAFHHCLCSSKHRSSWFDKVRFIHTHYTLNMLCIKGEACSQLPSYGCLLEGQGINDS